MPMSHVSIHLAIARSFGMPRNFGEPSVTMLIESLFGLNLPRARPTGLRSGAVPGRAVAKGRRGDVQGGAAAAESRQE